MALVFASQQTQLHTFVAVLVFGVVVGVFGHIIRSRPLIVAGIIIIAGITGYFAWFVQPS